MAVVRRKRLSGSFHVRLLAVLVALVAAGCAVSTRREVPRESIPPALEAAPDQLLAQYNRQAAAVRSINAAVELHPVAGSAYTGVIEEYREVGGFLLARRPAHIRVIGQAPVVGKNVFDMTSDGAAFRIFIPSKGRFITGPAEFERRSEKPIENLRPQHLLDALFWPAIEPDAPVLFEELDQPPARYYVLTVLRQGDTLEIARKIWFDRADFSVARVQIYSSGGRRAADVRYADWQPAGDTVFPRSIHLERPQDDYRLELRIERVTLNETLADDRFRLEQPAGTELVRLEAEAAKERP